MTSTHGMSDMSGVHDTALIASQYNSAFPVHQHALWQ